MQPTPVLDPERIRELVATPHDALFRGLISDAARADALIREHFPERLKCRLAGGPARQGMVGQVDSLLRQTFPDGVFMFGGSPGKPETVVITEAKHGVGPDVVEQLGGYLFGNRRYWLEQGARPHVMTMLVTMDPPPVEADWVRGRDCYGRVLLGNDSVQIACVWLAIAQLRYEVLSRMPVVRAVLGAMQCAYVEPAPLDTLGKVFRDLSGLPSNSVLWGMTYVYGMLMFALELADYNALIREADPRDREAEMATMFQQQMAERDDLRRAEGHAEGHAQGRTEGRAEGRAELLLRQVRRRFGTVPSDVDARVRSAPDSQVDAWADAVLDARSLDDLLKNGRLN